ncbi:ImmA/IrrE family metallo-endopeptidase [Eubacterium sp. MSJ-33]|uniref:ImmA/IrrE family metallo-endopeptidase n=1 Tax=Eubacterium sp. MSJ-33 TaxID=2841528 RepID=UPI001C7731A3|nr:ImmA/IrrE family metallo-endopeptidase [Eubacterium sp. MSJ-33]QWT54244.1 ImmA/IrrE family metallo-endopeptidase [Eubacterium sp. MSJ-33]
MEKDVKKIDEKTGKEIIERQEVIVPAYKVATVFDISQTTGKELPQIVTPLEGDIEAYQNFMEAIKASSPVPIEIRNIAKESVNGYYSQTLKKIVVQEGMEEMQTIKTAIHELSHAILHDEETGTEGKLDTKTKEVQAESVAYTVCQHYGIDTSDYSFGYIAGWSSSQKMGEFKDSLKTIQQTASEIIRRMDAILYPEKEQKKQKIMEKHHVRGHR